MSQPPAAPGIAPTAPPSATVLASPPAMQVLRQPVPLQPGTAACIGAFDGLHLGHQALLRRARALAPRVALVTFDPHPARVLAPERAPRLLQSPGQRARVCAGLGVDELVLLHFDRALADTSPEGFVQRLLIDGLRPRAVVVGADFRFGADRRGDAELLAALLRPAGIEVVAVSHATTNEPEPRRIERATVFVPDGKAKHFLNRFESYSKTTPKKERERRYEDMIDPVATLRLATLRGLWTDAAEAYPKEDETVWWEVWLRRQDGNELERLMEFAAAQEIEVAPRRLMFDDRLVTLVPRLRERLLPLGCVTEP